MAEAAGVELWDYADLVKRIRTHYDDVLSDWLSSVEAEQKARERALAAYRDYKPPTFQPPFPPYAPPTPAGKSEAARRFDHTIRMTWIGLALLFIALFAGCFHILFGEGGS